MAAVRRCLVLRRAVLAAGRARGRLADKAGWPAHGRRATATQAGGDAEKRPELFPRGVSVKRWTCRTAEDLKNVPPRVLALPHVAVAGRTNVGKSSMLNMLLRKDNIAKASSVQNKTRSVDFLCVDNRLVLTDLPGYPEGLHNRVWDDSLAELVDAYLDMCKPGDDNQRFDLRALLFLFDIRWNVLLQDDAFAQVFRENHVPLLLCLTKDDKVETHEYRKRRAERVRRDLAWTGPHVHVSSDLSLANSRRGRKVLMRYLSSFCFEAGSQDDVHTILSNAWSDSENDVDDASRRASIASNERDREEAKAPPSADAKFGIL